MSIDAVFIPCAGYGTRMGEIGKVIPKPLWTIAGVPLLELKIFQFQKLGFDRFILNSHHQAEKIKTFSKDSSLNILVSEEPEILGNGGSFHKIGRDYKNLKKVFVTNPDSFYFLESTDWKAFLTKANQGTNTLLGVDCDEGDSYNRLSKKGEDIFSGIETFGRDKLTSNQTYGGMGVIDLESFKNKEGESSF
ncbi:MAG: NTP transferase domain-containing protein, partial [Halobacteriovoraceae bacterium]|nr:NTP transferase domain-containing protein [Halobacteriovoraceae bacterium]